MILEHSTVFGKLLWTTESLNGVLFHWIPKEHKLSLLKSKKAYRNLIKLVLLQGIILSISIVQGHPKFQAVNIEEKLDFTDYFLYAIGILCNICNFCTSLALFKYREYICLYINGLDRFHLKYQKRSNHTKDKKPHYCRCYIS